MSITLQSRVHLAPDVLSQHVGAETVMLDVASQRYYSLNEVGARMWQLIGEHDDLAGILRRLCSEYATDAATLQHDLLGLIGQLFGKGLVVLEG